MSAVDDRDSWGRCEGVARIETRQETGDGDHFRVDSEMEPCAAMLSTAESREAMIISEVDGAGQEDASVETVRFVQGSSALHVSCTLLRMFGAQARPYQSAAMRSVVWVPANVGAIQLVGDIVVREGSSLALRAEEGASATLVLGKSQLRVEPGASLELIRIELVDAFGGGSALHVEGTASVVNGTFARCKSEANVLARYLEAAVPLGDGDGAPVAGAALGSAGGAVIVLWSAAQLRVSSGVLRDNEASGGSVFNWGGALFAIGGYISLTEASLHHNVAAGGRFSVSGGAMSGAFAYIEMADTVLLANEARQRDGAITNSFNLGGGVWVQSSTAKLRRCRFEGNAVSSAGGSGYGGAMFVDRSTVEVNGSWFSRNEASAGGKYAQSGAVHVTPGGRLAVASTTFESHVAHGATSSVECGNPPRHLAPLRHAHARHHSIRISDSKLSPIETRTHRATEGALALRPSGAIHVYGGEMALASGVVFRENAALASGSVSSRGGAVCVSEGGQFIADDGGVSFV
jgi:hypothetical protein